MMSKKEYEKFLRKIDKLDKTNLNELKTFLIEKKSVIEQLNKDNMTVVTIMVIEELEKKIKLVTRRIESSLKTKQGVTDGNNR